MIKIALCTDTYYMMACGPCVVSIFEHHREQPCHIYVITKSLPQVDVEGLEQIAARYGGRLTSDGQDYSSGDSARPESKR